MPLSTEVHLEKCSLHQAAGDGAERGRWAKGDLDSACSWLAVQLG